MWSRFAVYLVSVSLHLAVAAAGAEGAALAIDGVTARPASVPKYAKVELTVALSNVAATKPYEPDPTFGGLDLSAAFTSPSSTVWNLKGFYDGAAWRVRFAPNETGTWAYAVTAADPSGTSTTVRGTFECVASSYPGWARIDGKCLRFTEGQVVFGVGHNTGWQLDVEQPPLASMAAKGENLLSFWLATPWAEAAWGAEWAARTPIENAADGIGNYNQAACAYLDAVIERAEAAGVCLLPTIWSHGQLRGDGHPWGAGWWYNNAYSTVCSAAGFFDTNGTMQWRYQRNFYRYLIARYGYSRALAGFVAICEIDGTSGWAANQSQALAWCAAVRDFFSANDPFRRNASGQTPAAGTRVNAASWESGFDLRSTDSYASQYDNVGVALTIATDTQVMRRSGKPSFHAEFGGNTSGGASQPAHLHNGIWAAATNGAAMTPLVWCDGGSFPMLTAAMQDHLQYLAQFMAGIDYLGSPSLSTAAVSVKDSNLRGWGMKLADRGYAWVQRKNAGSLGGQTVSISSLAAGHYTVQWFNPWASGATPIQTATVTVAGDGVLRAAIPSLACPDVALRFAPAPSINNPPVASCDSYTTNQNQTLDVPAPGVLGNDTDADGDPLTAILAAGPAHGSVTLRADGSFTYTPTTGYTGTDSLTYEAYDGTTLSNETTVTITVGPAGPTAILSVAMSRSTSKTYWKATAAVTVKDAAGKAIGGATLAGHWSGLATGNVTGTTNSKGKVSFTSASIRTSGTAKFTTDTVTKNGQSYTLTGQTSASITGAPGNASARKLP